MDELKDGGENSIDVAAPLKPARADGIGCEFNEDSTSCFPCGMPSGVVADLRELAAASLDAGEPLDGDAVRCLLQCQSYFGTWNVFGIVVVSYLEMLCFESSRKGLCARVNSVNRAHRRSRTSILSRLAWRRKS